MWSYSPDCYYRAFGPFGIPGPSMPPPIAPPFFPQPGMQPFPSTQPPVQTPTQGGPPAFAPPSTIPPRPPQLPQGVSALIDPGAIVSCRNKFTYIWQSNGASYWMFITFVGPNSIAGWRWVGPGIGWVNFGLDLRFVDSSVCVP